MLHICYTLSMSAKSPRIHTVLELPLYKLVKRLAEEHGSSLSEEAGDLIREAVELREDRALDLFAESRRKTFDGRKALTLVEVRKRLRAR